MRNLHSDAFVELNRTFHELSANGRLTDDDQLRAALFRGDTLAWEQLLQEYRVVILSEAGSGKTEEIRHQTDELRAKGNPAFFLRLEHVATDFEEAFEIGSHEEFKNWVASESEGWLLLDSVDEARLRDPRDFELAIKRIGHRIGSAHQRAHIIITGRTTAWRPKTDLALCEASIPYVPPQVIGKEEGDSEQPPQDVSATSQQSNPEKSVFKVVALDDLTAEQLKIFADRRGVKDTRAFVDAIERADAFSFTSRPQDLAEVIDFWLSHGRVGSAVELMRNSIDRRLLERDQNRAEVRPIDSKRLRLGAQLLAAAASLTQRQTIRVPDGGEGSEGLPVKAVLSNWDDRDCATLLSRPIFDEALYGTVRFHHRSVREYLAAEWLNGLLLRKASPCAS